MIYYAVIYLKDDTIHLKPFETRYDAEAYCEKALMHHTIKLKIKKAKVLKKDLSKPCYQNCGGFWL